MDLLKILAKCGLEITDEVKENIKKAQETFLDSYVKKSEVEKKELELEAFKEQVNKLKNDKTLLNESLEQAKTEFDNYKIGLEKEKINTDKTNLLINGFKENGLMNEKLISLLLKGIDLDTIEIKDNAITDLPKIIEPLKNDYSDFFGEVKIEGKPPKINNQPNKPSFTLESVQSMSEKEINENWDTIQNLLGQGE